MSAYRTIVVGTDGSDTSLAAVDRAAAVAADSDAELVVVCAYTPAGREETAGAEDVLKDEAFLVVGWTPAEETLRTAEDRAVAAGAKSATWPPTPRSTRRSRRSSSARRGATRAR